MSSNTGIGIGRGKGIVGRVTTGGSTPEDSVDHGHGTGTPFWKQGFEEFLNKRKSEYEFLKAKESGEEEGDGGEEEGKENEGIQKGGEEERMWNNRGRPPYKQRFHQENEKKDVRRMTYDDQESRQKRREEWLSSQKKRRDELLDQIRVLEATSDSEIDDDEDFMQFFKPNNNNKQNLEIDEPEELSKQVEVEEEDMDTTGGEQPKRGGPRKGYRRFPKKDQRAPYRLMMSDWMFEKPCDFDDNWIGVLCPVGKRCMVVAGRGKTFVFSRRNEYLGQFRSLLPGGHVVDERDFGSGQNRGVTILDCVWSTETESFYVLDLICWRSQSYINCDKAFRQYFQTSKFTEDPALLQKSTKNPYPFVPLPSFDCDKMGHVMMDSLPIFKQKVDGVLFFHKKSFYFRGVNPLCLWLYLTDIEEKLQVTVSPDMLAFQKSHPKQERHSLLDAQIRRQNERNVERGQGKGRGRGQRMDTQ